MHLLFGGAAGEFAGMIRDSILTPIIATNISRPPSSNTACRHHATGKPVYRQGPSHWRACRSIEPKAPIPRPGTEYLMQMLDLTRGVTGRCGGYVTNTCTWQSVLVR